MMAIHGQNQQQRDTEEQTPITRCGGANLRKVNDTETLRKETICRFFPFSFWTFPLVTTTVQGNTKNVRLVRSTPTAEDGPVLCVRLPSLERWLSRRGF